MYFKHMYCRISPNLVLEDVCKTNHKDYRKANIEWGFLKRENLKKTAIEVYEPLRARFGQFYINSGIRCPTLNEKINGSKNSAHIEGNALDLRPVDYNILASQVFEYLREDKNFLVGQVILYPDLDFIHVGRYAGLSKRDFRIYEDGKYNKV